MKKILFLLIISSLSTVIFRWSGQQLIAQKIGQARIDSLLEILNTNQNNIQDFKTSDTNKIKLLIDLAYEYHKVDPDIGINFGAHALKLSKAIQWKHGICLANNRIGLCYWAKSDFPKSMEFHFTALKLAEEINNKYDIAIICGNIGLVYNDQLNFVKALEYHFKALKLNEQLNDKSKIALNLGNLGIVYDAQGNYSKSLEYYSKALKYYQELGDKGGVARNLGNMGFVYQELNNQTKALEYYYKALKMNQEIGNRILTGMNLGNIGETYFVIANDTSTQKKYTVPDSLQKEGAIKNSRYYLKTAIAFFEEINDYNSLSELYQYLANLEALSGNFEASLNAYKRHAAAKDSVFNENNNIRIDYLEKNREEDLKQKQIELLQSQNKIGQLTAQRSQVINYGLTAAFFLLVIVAFTLFNQSKKRKKINEELATAYQHLKSTQQQLVQSEKLAAIGTVATRMAHEIQNPLNFVNNFSELSEELIHEIVSSKDDNEKADAAKSLLENLQKINHHGKRASAIVSHLQEHSNKGTTHEFFDEDN